MDGPAIPEFGRRKPVEIPQGAPAVKRSGHVMLLLMGSLAVGGGGYALMPRESCQPTQPGAAAPSPAPSSTACTSRGGSWGSGRGYWGGSSHFGFFGADASTSRQPSDARPSSGGVTRGGFGAFADAISSHFSRGG